MTRTQFMRGIDEDKSLSLDPIYHSILEYLRDYILKEHDVLQQISPDRRPAITFFVPTRKELFQMIGMNEDPRYTTISLAGLVYEKLNAHKHQSKFKQVLSLSLDFESENFLWIRIKADAIGSVF